MPILLIKIWAVDKISGPTNLLIRKLAAKLCPHSFGIPLIFCDMCSDYFENMRTRKALTWMLDGIATLLIALAVEAIAARRLWQSHAAQASPTVLLVEEGRWAGKHRIPRIPIHGSGFGSRFGPGFLFFIVLIVTVVVIILVVIAFFVVISILAVISFLAVVFFLAVFSLLAVVSFFVVVSLLAVISLLGVVPLLVVVASFSLSLVVILVISARIFDFLIACLDSFLKLKLYVMI